MKHLLLSLAIGLLFNACIGPGTNDHRHHDHHDYDHHRHHRR